MISFNYIVFDMFRTTKCSSSGSLYQSIKHILTTTRPLI